MRAILQSATYQRSSQATAREQARRALLLALLSQAAQGRGADRRPGASHRRADASSRSATAASDVQRFAAGQTGHAAGRRRRQRLFLQVVRPSGPANHLRVRAVLAADHGPGVEHQQRRHAQSEARSQGQSASTNCSPPAPADEAILDDLYLAAPLARLPTRRRKDSACWRAIADVGRDRTACR